MGLGLRVPDAEETLRDWGTGTATLLRVLGQVGLGSLRATT